MEPMTDLPLRTVSKDRQSHRAVRGQRHADGSAARRSERNAWSNDCGVAASATATSVSVSCLSHLTIDVVSGRGAPPRSRLSTAVTSSRALLAGVPRVPQIRPTCNCHRPAKAQDSFRQTLSSPRPSPAPGSGPDASPSSRDPSAAGGDLEQRPAGRGPARPMPSRPQPHQPPPTNRRPATPSSAPPAANRQDRRTSWYITCLGMTGTPAGHHRSWGPRGAQRVI